MSQLDLRILTPDGPKLEGPADCLRVATESGLLEVYPNHADLLGTIGFSHLWAIRGAHTDHMLVRHGILAVDSVANSARVMAFDCQKKDSVDVQTLRQYYDMLSGLLKAGGHGKTQTRFLAGEISSMEKLLSVTTEEKNGNGGAR